MLFEVLNLPLPFFACLMQFETMVNSKQIHEFRCFYETAARKFHSVVQVRKLKQCMWMQAACFDTQPC